MYNVDDRDCKCLLPITIDSQVAEWLRQNTTLKAESSAATRKSKP